jgi:SPP1 family predicted phage head-tail adaptor
MDAAIVQPGTLKHLITISQPSQTRDSAGQLNSEWTPLLTTRAAILSTASQSFRWSFTNNALAANSTSCIVIRYPGAAIDIVPGLQIQFEDETFEVQAVDDVQHRHRVINLACVGLDVGSS